MACPQTKCVCHREGFTGLPAKHVIEKAGHVETLGMTAIAPFLYKKY